MKHQIKNLEVIGCAEVPHNNPYLPRFLTAIFCSTPTVIYPPYEIKNGEVHGGVTAMLRDFQEKVELKEVTKCEPRPAQNGWHYWLDDEGNISYDHESVISKNLANIGAKNYDLGLATLIMGDFIKAQRYALISSAAKVEDRDAIVLRAAAEHCMVLTGEFPNAESELKLTEFIAGDIASFRKEYYQLVNLAI